ncbi:hypothetical protein tinsulaeT_00550 [Thalassotalea insulae]|uniref:Uncharacterized protein n=1 Tax=Thalassotalea insulae TaxID=2056778 RepID=A0ABQ6GPS2_9GAMM|nr:hypothetical protein [Thalassotalea insulae]GLX76715.1 hypothetical protein tinsulaeT_00550 [Thalassotalea insulae]
MKSHPWVKIYDETQEDCILGNREGLQALKFAIDEALESKCVEIKDQFQSDFGHIALSEQPWDESEIENKEGIWGIVIPFILFIWMVALPIFGIYKLVF